MCFGVLTGSAAHPTPFSAFHLPAYTTLSPSTCAIAPRSLRFLSCLQLCFCFVDFCCKPVAWPVLVVVVFYVSHCCCSSPVYVFSSLTSSGCIALALQSSLFGNVFNSLCRYHRGRSCSRRWRWRCFFPVYLNTLLLWRMTYNCQRGIHSRDVTIEGHSLCAFVLSFSATRCYCCCHHYSCWLLWFGWSHFAGLAKRCCVFRRNCTAFNEEGRHFFR